METREILQLDTAEDKKKRSFSRRRGCRFCGDHELVIDYKEPATLTHFIGDRGKIVPRRVTGICATHQRIVATAIKRARQLALLSYTETFYTPAAAPQQDEGGAP